MRSPRAGRGGALVTALSLLRAVVPVVLAVVALGVVAVQVGAANLRQAEEDRLRNRAELVTATAKGQADAQMGRTELNTALALPLAPGALNQAMIGLFATSGAFDATSAVVLYDRAGTPQASVPDGASLDVAQLGPAFADTLAGAVAWSPAFTYDGKTVTAMTVPIKGDTPWGVVAIVRAAATTSTQAMFVRLGALDGDAGGLSIVDPAGVVLQSWDTTRIGTTALTPAEVAALPLDDTARWTAGATGRETTHLGRRLPSGYAVVFEQRSDLLFGDLRAAQRQRDRTMVTVLVVLTLALAAFQLARQRAARRSEERIRTLLEHGQDLILVADRHGRLTFVSPSIGLLLGHRPATWLHRPLADLAHPADHDRLARLAGEPGAGPLTDVRLARHDGSYRWFDIEADDHSGNPEIAGVLLTGHEVGERKQLEDELAHQATHDRLTGVANRVELSRRLDALIANGRPRQPFALLYLDLDGFKPINDTLGHSAGDHVLTTVAERMGHAAGTGSLVCRFGGDEFGILVPGAERRAAEHVAQALLDAVRRPVAYLTELVQIDASIGVALASPDHVVTDGETLIREADQAMYGAKQAGRGRYLVTAPASHDEDPCPRAARPSAAGIGHQAAEPDPSLTATFGLAARSGGVPTSPPRRRPAGSRRRALRRRVLAALPLAVAIAMVTVVAGIGQRQSTESRHASEALRLDNALTQTARIAELYSRLTNPQTRIAGFNAIPWALDGGPVDQMYLDSILHSPFGGPDSLMVLSRIDGEVLATAPAGRRPPVPPDAPAWHVARAGRAAVVPMVTVDGVALSLLLVPVLREGRAAGVLSMGFALDAHPLLETLKNLGRPGVAGDYSLVTGEGIAFLSWDTELVGRSQADPAALASIGSAGSAVIANGNGRISIAAPLPSWSETTPVYFVFSASSASFYQDLHAGQGMRDATLVGVVLAAAAGLTLLHQRRERDARRSQRRLDALLHGAHDLITVVDGTTAMTFVSSAITSLLGDDPHDARGRPFAQLAHPDDRDRIGAAVASTCAQGAAVVRDVRLRTLAGTHRWFDIEANELPARGRESTVLLTCHEITRRREIAEHLAYQASHDLLTGLPNRASFAAALEEITAGDRPFAVLFIDLDHFKPVNDTYGHDAGDAVLRTIATRLRGSIRTGAGNRAEDLICRLGGDEFTIVLANSTPDDAATVAERIIATVSEPIAVAGTEVRVGATIGIALSQVTGDHPAQTVRHADAAMYRAKQAGRGRYDMFIS